MCQINCDDLLILGCIIIYLVMVTTGGYHIVRRSNRYWAGLWTDLTIEQVMMITIKSRGGLTRGRGMSEIVRMLWIYSMHRCSQVHESMTKFTEQQQMTST